jgi:RNA polymerase sigma-70 factor (ECF subfamily)
MGSSAAWRQDTVERPDGRDAEGDRHLVLAYRSGDPDAFSVIFDRHYPRLLAQARAILGRNGGAEDACQETFRKALEGIGRFGRGGEWRIGAWLSTILRSVCVDQLARAHRDRTLAAVIAVEANNVIDVADQVADPGEMHAVKDAIGHLRPPLRRALVMRAVQGCSYAELAAAEHITEECARMRTSRARRSVRRELA